MIGRASTTRACSFSRAHRFRQELSDAGGSPVPLVDGFAPGDSNYRYIWSQLPEPHPRARGAATSYQAPQDKQKTWAKAGWNTERE
jgi:hypothetical protein